MLNDGSTINTILSSQVLGFYQKGEGGRSVEGGVVAPGGQLAVSTNGGDLSCVQPGTHGTHSLLGAVVQRQDQAGARQTRDLNMAQMHGSGGMLFNQHPALPVMDAAP